MKNRRNELTPLINNTSSKKGITLIALIVTIIILLILAGVVISMLTGENAIIVRAKEAEFKTKMASYKETADLYTVDQIATTLSSNTKWINSGELLKEAINDEVIEDITLDDVNIPINEILKEITEKEKDYIVIYKGQLHYVSNPNVPNNAEQTKWCEQIGIPILDYSPPTGIVVKNGNYELVKGIYLCTPNLTDGFVQEKTRYLEVASNGSIVPGNWVTHRPTENWYDYKNQQWANVHVESDGQEIYYVWIPRYCFTLDQTTQKSEVKFIDIDNSYKDTYGNVTTWEELVAQAEAEGKKLQIPEAFTFNGQPIAGFWATKYTVGDVTSPTTINYDMAVSRGIVTIKNVTLNTTITASNPIVKYTVALNGKIVQTIDNADTVANINAEVIEFSNLRVGDNTINLTGLNAKGEIVGSMTKEYSSPVVNKPDTSAFNQDTTFYVTYDENGNEHSTVPVSKAAPAGWYDYGSSEWANIVTRNNEGEIYYVWIPRYQFKLDQINQRSTVKFITGTGTIAEEGYQIPEAFTFNGQPIAGFWSTKYTIGDVGTATFTTDVVVGATSITTKGITGSGVIEGLTYNYYIDGVLKGSKTNATEEFAFTGLTEGKQYTVLVEVRDSQTDAYVGTIVKQDTPTGANKPDLTGFNADCTYYVLYDEEGNETISTYTIKNDGSNAPEGWYDYSKSKWANIVVKTKDASGNDLTTYFTWIPRYQFRLDQQNQRSIVKFISGTGTAIEAGYQIPEAFTFNGQQLTGFWSTKYTIGG